MADDATARALPASAPGMLRPGIEDVATPAGRSQFCGVGSCAASNCHGGVAHPGSTIRGDEYLIWRLQDPHARAYQDLLSGLGMEIVSNLAAHPVASFTDAPLDIQRRCLACHATHGLDDAPGALINDGVTCESCHGNASHWLAAHTQSTWFDGATPAQQQPSEAQRRALGFVPTDNLIDRARRCVACHVGTIDGDVNHDLYAAGHPQMHFELFAYDAQLPRHWSDDKQRRLHGEDYPHDLFVAGTLVGAEAALELLEGRIDREIARRDNQPADRIPHVWPELTEYSCFACHQDLGPSSAYRTGPTGGARTGEIASWGTWNTAFLDRMATDPAPWQTVIAADSLRSLTDELAAVREAMGKLYLPKDQLGDLKTHTSAARTQLQATVDGLRDREQAFRGSNVEVLNARADWLRKMIAAHSSSSWDDAVQLYLAQESLRASKLPITPERAELRDRLTFPRQPVLFDSPYRDPATTEANDGP